MAMKFRAHDTFFIRKGWLSKGMKYVHNRADVFVSRDENPTDVLGIGTNMVKALRYWLQAVGVTQEPVTGRRVQTFTELGNQIYEHDRYIEELGTLQLLHYKLASNKEEATAWYFFFNEFKMTEFTREDFVSALQSYVLMSDEDISVALRSLNDDFACIINTYLPRYKSTPGRTKMLQDFAEKCNRSGQHQIHLMLICDDAYSLTPVVNNEAINRNDITSIASNSRSKIIAGLLRNELEHNLGLSGSGQEVSIMRSTLLRTGVLVTDNSLVRIELKPDDELIRNMLTTIVSFIQETKAAGSVSFGVLYRRLAAPENHIGLRKGLIPIYLAAVFHEFKQELILQDRFGQVSITADTLLQVNANPDGFTLAYLDWDPEKAEFIQRLADIFSDYVIEAEKLVNAYDYVVSAMKRWYMALPKYAKELKRSVKGQKVDKRYLAMLRLLNYIWHT